MSGNRALSREAYEFEEVDKRVWIFMYMPCDPKARAAAANERAVTLGGTPENIRCTVLIELQRMNHA